MLTAAEEEASTPIPITAVPFPHPTICKDPNHLLKNSVSHKDEEQLHI
jgi:hypothetical protein